MEGNNIFTNTQQTVIDKLFADILEAPNAYDIKTASESLPKVADIIAEEMQLMYGEKGLRA